MTIAICSAFRNSARNRQAQRYLRQVQALARNVAPHRVRVIAGEGDSTDNTRDVLSQTAQQLGIDLELLDLSHRGRHFGSVENPERMKLLSGVCNGMLEAIREDDRVVLYVESDLIWDPFTVTTLLASLNPTTPMIAPLTMAGENFYDIWGFRKDGQRFSPFPPYFPGLEPGTFFPVDSVGSCFVALGEILRQARVRDDNALVGLCEDIRRLGYPIFVRSDLRVNHPC